MFYQTLLSYIAEVVLNDNLPRLVSKAGSIDNYCDKDRVGMIPTSRNFTTIMFNSIVMIFRD